MKHCRTERTAPRVRFTTRVGRDEEGGMCPENSPPRRTEAPCVLTDMDLDRLARLLCARVCVHTYAYVTDRSAHRCVCVFIYTCVYPDTAIDR